jgi:hypothetical protein
MKDLFFQSLGIGLLFLAVFFGFRTKQAIGSRRMNSFEAKYGGGSFMVFLKTSTMTVIWGMLCFASVFGGGAAFNQLETKTDQGGSSQTGAAPAASSTAPNAIPVSPPLSVPELTSKAEATNEAPTPKADQTKENPSLVSSPAEGKVNSDENAKENPSETTFAAIEVTKPLLTLPQATQKSPEQIPGLWSPAMTLATDKTNVRAEGSVEAPVLRQLMPSVPILVSTTDSDWWQIRLDSNSGVLGWVRKDRVALKAH